MIIKIWCIVFYMWLGLIVSLVLVVGFVVWVSFV